MMLGRSQSFSCFVSRRGIKVRTPRCDGMVGIFMLTSLIRSLACRGVKYRPAELPRLAYTVLTYTSVLQDEFHSIIVTIMRVSDLLRGRRAGQYHEPLPFPADPGTWREGPVPICYPSHPGAAGVQREWRSS